MNSKPLDYFLSSRPDKTLQWLEESRDSWKEKTKATKNGGLVQAELSTILEANQGIPPLALVKDHGSDLRCGGRLFCEAHPGVIDVYDVPHKIACLYERQLRDDELWESFTKKCADFKKQ